MENCYGQHGWREFNSNRKNILSELDKALELIQNRPIQVAHGQAVEAYIRKWLSEFLPKKYGVTSGYIVPDLYDHSAKLYHYDIIIYNQLEAPILWTEGNYDQSDQGKFRAIPAKYVSAVYEVKARLTKDNVIDALKKLDETKVFVEQLPRNYTCGIIFIDLKESDNNSESIIKALLKDNNVFGFVGGVVVRYEGDKSCTGLITISNTESQADLNNQLITPIAKPIDDLDIHLTERGNLVIAEQRGGTKLVATSVKNWSVAKIYTTTYCQKGKCISILWSKGGFADFCINLISSLEGLAFNDKNRPVFGQIFDIIKRKKAPLQGKEKKVGLPFLIAKVYQGNQYGEHLIINSEVGTIQFLIQFENHGDITAITSHDFFAHKKELPANSFGIEPLTLNYPLSKKEERLIDVLKKDPLNIPFRLVYHPAGRKDELYAIEVVFKISDQSVEILAQPQNPTAE